MAPKFAKGKGVAKGAGTVEPPESALSGDRTKSAFFFPSTVDVQELRASFKPLWGVKTGGEDSGHPATRIIPAACADPASNRYPFFVDYFSCGLCPLRLSPLGFYSECGGVHGFLRASLRRFCQGAAQHGALAPLLLPSDPAGRCRLWLRHLDPKIQGAYPDGAVKDRWEEWRGRWC